MKVAIPTDDKVKICPDILACKGYLVYEIDDHSLVNYIFMPNPYFDDVNLAKQELCNTLSECNAIICNKINTVLKEKLKSTNTQILVTLEENAKKALINLMCRV